MGPTSKEELESVLHATPKSMAPGPDGRRFSDLKGLNLSKLGWVVNSVL